MAGFWELVKAGGARIAKGLGMEGAALGAGGLRSFGGSVLDMATGAAKTLGRGTASKMGASMAGINTGFGYIGKQLWKKSAGARKFGMYAGGISGGISGGGQGWQEGGFEGALWGGVRGAAGGAIKGGIYGTLGGAAFKGFGAIRGAGKGAAGLVEKTGGTIGKGAQTRKARNEKVMNFGQNIIGGITGAAKTTGGFVGKQFATGELRGFGAMGRGIGTATMKASNAISKGQSVINDAIQNVWSRGETATMKASNALNSAFEKVSNRMNAPIKVGTGRGRMPKTRGSGKKEIDILGYETRPEGGFLDITKKQAKEAAGKRAISGRRQANDMRATQRFRDVTTGRELGF